MDNWLVPSIGSLIITVIFMPGLIKYFRNKKEGQTIREEGPTWHESKSGTPTMGGILFIIAAIVSCIGYGLFANILNPTLWILLLVLGAYGLIGMWDDSIKIFHHQNEGLKAWQKMVAQICVAIIFGIVYAEEGFPLAIKLPFGGDLFLGYFYILFIILWLVGFSNAVNLTDGLDGLVSGLGAIAFLAYAIIAFVQKQFDVMTFCLAIVGGLIGFFFFNHKPAKIFMGDMGSLALGAALAAVSILLHHEFSLLVIGMVFVLETLSVILQVFWFRRTGNRIFKMTPIHHHFEMSGWSEWKIDIIFWLIGLGMALIALVTII